MQTLFLSTCWARRAALTVGLIMASSAVLAAGTGNQTDVEARYQKERAQCQHEAAGPQRDTCLKEAGAARDEARRGAVHSDAAPQERNARARCQALPASDRPDCLARVRGEGTQRGSVKEGGIYKESVTVEIGAPAQRPAASAPIRSAP
jgi:hypothetical protein